MGHENCPLNRAPLPFVSSHASLKVLLQPYSIDTETECLKKNKYVAAYTEALNGKCVMHMPSEVS